jgi:hypothetical protein
MKMELLKQIQVRASLNNGSSHLRVQRRRKRKSNKSDLSVITDLSVKPNFHQ